VRADRSGRELTTMALLAVGILLLVEALLAGRS
jgi:hypothetical protein